MITDTDFPDNTMLLPRVEGWNERLSTLPGHKVLYRNGEYVGWVAPSITLPGVYIFSWKEAGRFVSAFTNDEVAIDPRPDHIAYTLEDAMNKVEEKLNG